MAQQPPSPAQPLLALPGMGDDADIDATPPRAPWWRRRGPIITISIILLAILLGAFLLRFLNRRQPKNYDFQPVTQGTLALTINATGPLQSGVYNVVFTGSGGKLTEIDVKVGQTVKKGDVLAKLDQTSLQDAVNQAQSVVNAAEANLGSTQNSLGATQAQTQGSVAEAQTTLTNDQAALINTQKESQASINSAQTTLTNDQANFTNVQAESQASINSAQTTLNNDQTTLNNTEAQSQASINSAQTTLNNDQTALNNTEAQSSAQLNSAYTTEQQAIAACNSATTPTPNCVQAAQNAYNQVVATTNAANSAAQAKVNSDQQALNQARTAANANNAAAQGKVNADQQALNSARTTANANNAAAQAKITSDQQALNSAIATANTNNATAQARIVSDQKALAEASASAESSVTSSQGQLTTQQGVIAGDLAQLQTAQDNLANATLVAPHNGTITVINGTVGGSPGVATSTATTASAASTGTFIQIVDTSALQVQAAVNEADTAHLKVGDAATFTVNAYGSRVFNGTVAAVSPNGQTSSNVVTYPVYIDVDMSQNNLQNATLLPGMTANVTVTVLNRPDVLLLPVNAINYARLASISSSTNGAAIITTQAAATAMRQARQMLFQLETQNVNVVSDSPIPAYVLEQSGGKIVAKPVVVGLTDGTVYEALSGLSNGEEVIVGTGGSGSSSGTSGGAGGGARFGG